MAKNVQHVRHDAAEAATFIGLEGQITVDYSNYYLKLHDGITPGGYTFVNTDALSVMFQPLSGTLTQLSGLVTTVYGRSLLTVADGATLVSSLGLDDAVDTISGDANSGISVSRIGNSVQISAQFASQADAVAGMATTKPMNALRVAQAISALTPAVPVSSQAQAEAGTDNATFMTPLRVAQGTAYLKPKFAVDGAPANWMLGTLAYSDSVTLAQLANGVRGDSLYAGANGWTLLSAGTSGQVLTTGGAGADPSWGWGSHVQRVTATMATWTALNASGTERIPGDDTKPQSSEGKQIITCSITPKASTHILRVRAFVPQVAPDSAVQVTLVGSLFRDNSSDALQTAVAYFNGAFNQQFEIETEVTAGSTSAITFSLRLGPVENYACHVLGNSSSRLFGGAMAVTMIVDEFKA